MLNDHAGLVFPLSAAFAFIAAMSSCSPSLDDATPDGAAGSGAEGDAAPGKGGGEDCCGAEGMGGASGADGDVPVTVVATENLISFAPCQANPAKVLDLPAETYSVLLEDSTLSKGSVDTEPKQPSKDDYVVVHAPTISEQERDHRFFMLNGIGAQRSITLEQPGSLEFIFIDSDLSGNHGFATITVNPGGHKIFVDSEVHVLVWRNLCQAEPARIDVGAGRRLVTLDSSDLSSAQGRRDDYVIVRTPSEIPNDPYRYVILNGLGASFEFDTPSGGPFRAWFITAGGQTTGKATVTVSIP